MHSILLILTLAVADDKLPMQGIIDASQIITVEPKKEIIPPKPKVVYSCTDKFGRLWRSDSQAELNKILVRENAKYWYGKDLDGYWWKNLYKWQLEEDIRGINEKILRRRAAKKTVYIQSPTVVYQQAQSIQRQVFTGVPTYNAGSFAGVANCSPTG